MAIYNRLPVFGQNLACSSEGARIERSRYGEEFWAWLKAYERLVDCSLDERLAYRDKALRKMVLHAYGTVPHWRNVFDEGGIDPASIRCLDDLGRLPLLTKEDIRANPGEFLSSSVGKADMVAQHTSGTTGAGLHFYTTRGAQAAQWAMWWRYRRVLGIPYGTQCAVFGGRPVVPHGQEGGPYFRNNAPAKQYLFSQYHLGEQTMPEYVRELRGLGVTWLHGYPSVLSLLASWLVEHGETLPMEHVTTGAENLLESQRRVMREAFCTDPRQHYGLSEAVANFSERPDGRMLVDEEFAAVELVDNGWGAREVVGTSLVNYAMPLLRYRTNDVAEFVEGPEGREVTSLDGRLEDFIVLSDGSRVGRLDHLFKDMVRVREAQLVQAEPGSFTVRLVPAQDFGSADEAMLDGEIRSRMGDVEYSLELVEAIERTASGKLRFVVSGANGGVL